MTIQETIAIDEFCELIGEYEQFLSVKAEGTSEAYLRTVRHLMGWIAQLPGNEHHFQPRQLTQPAVELYLNNLEQQGMSINYRARVKSTISNFAHFLIEEKGLLRRNPTRGIDLPSPPPSSPQALTPEQRSILCALVEQADDQRGAALFALGYWAGCRVSEVSWLCMADTHIGPGGGWLHVGDKGNRCRDINLLNRARKPLYAYLQATDGVKRTYVFTSQRSERLTEEGIYYWFRTLKDQSSKSQRKLIEHLTFHDLRHDFSRRAREAGWPLEKVASYLGYINRMGGSPLQTTLPTPQLGREHIKLTYNNGLEAQAN